MNLEELQKAAASCTFCELSKGRINPVFSKGDPNSNIMVCGMVPAVEENNAGVPFVGRAGKLLDDILLDADLPEGSAYITNLVKCFLAAGLPLKQEWIDACIPYLITQIGLINPRVIITLGKDATINLLGLDPKMSLGRIRGETFLYDKSRVVPTYHPSFLLRKGGRVSREYQVVVDDFIKAKEMSC